MKFWINGLDVLAFIGSDAAYGAPTPLAHGLADRTTPSQKRKLACPRCGAPARRFVYVRSPTVWNRSSFATTTSVESTAMMTFPGTAVTLLNLPHTSIDALYWTLQV